MEHRSVSYGWVVVAAAATIICVGMGALFSLGVFLVPIERSMGWSRGAISTVALLNWIAMGLGSFCWGALSDRIGGRGVALAGGFLLGLGLVLASQAQTLWQFYLTFGFLVGFSVGAFYAPLTSSATKWFTARRSRRSASARWPRTVARSGPARSSSRDPARRRRQSPADRRGSTAPSE